MSPMAPSILRACIQTSAAVGYTAVTNRIPVDQDATFLPLEITFTP
jgi:hypothetical protein